MVLMAYGNEPWSLHQFQSARQISCNSNIKPKMIFASVFLDFTFQACMLTCDCLSAPGKHVLSVLHHLHTITTEPWLKPFTTTTIGTCQFTRHPTIAIASCHNKKKKKVKPHLPLHHQTSKYCHVAHQKKKNWANTAASLAKLLPTGTVLLFQALTPSLANTTGKCHVFNKYYLCFLIAFCAATCFLSSFTDSFSVEGKLYHGFATFKGFWVVNIDRNRPEEKERIMPYLKLYKIEVIDHIHAFISFLVLCPASCFPFSKPGVKGLGTQKLTNNGYSSLYCIIYQ